MNTIEAIAPERMDTKQAAVFLSIKAQTLVNWRCNGTGPAFIRMGNLVRYNRADLEAWVEQQTVRPAAAA